MEPEDAEMTPPRSEPSRSVPSSPNPPRASAEEPTTPRRVSMPSIPAPPPLLPLLVSPTTPATRPDEDTPDPDESLLPSFVGTLESFLRSAARQNKWALVLVLPKNFPSSSPSSPTRPIRPAWGAGAYHQPKKMYAPRDIADHVMLWRRTMGSSDAAHYQAFFPVDGHPHLALLDPRSGERLAVWGNTDGEGMVSHNAISDGLWNLVLDEINEFLKTHSLEEDALGPAHFQEKPWAVRTRRVAPRASSSTPEIPPTSVMDDEDAAIAAAIAASLAEAASNDEGSSSDDDYQNDDESSDSSDETLSSESVNQDEVGAAEQGSSSADEDATLSEDSSEQDSTSMDISSSDSEPRRAVSMPVSIPSRGEVPTPSSVESLSHSYIERMESCFRSNTDPALLEARRLRAEQDEELARSLQEDRKRMREEELVAKRRAAKKVQQVAADARLPEEPGEGMPGVFTIALRLPGGSRTARRFNSFDKLSSIADFAIAQVGCVDITKKAPTTVLRIPGVPFEASSWETKLSELALSSRTMFVLSAE